MELFNLIAKLTLDANEFNRELQKAENEANKLQLEDYSLDLDPDGFTSGIEEAQEAADSFTPPDEENELNMNESNFTEGIDEAQESSDDFTPPEEDNELNLDPSDYTEGLDEAESKSLSFSESVKSIFNELSGVIAGLGIAATIGAIVSTLKEGVELAKNHGDMIDKQSQKMGISAKAYQEWAYALNLSGASIDDLNRGLRTWQQAVGDEDATAKLGDAFSKLGMDAEKAIKQLESGENLDNLLDQVLYSLADYEGSDGGAIAEALFGKNATQLNALLNQTAQEIRNAKEEANDLGLIMTDEEVKNAAAYMDATTRLEGALNGIKEAFAADILPLLTDATNAVAQIVAFFNPRTNEKSLSERFAGDDEQLTGQLATIESTSDAANLLLDKLIAMGDASNLTAEKQAEWRATAEQLIQKIPELSNVIDIDKLAIEGDTEAIKKNITEWENLARQRALSEAIEKKEAELIKANEKLIEKRIEAKQRENDADIARAEAMDNVNKVLEKYGLDTLGEGATLADINAASQKLTSMYSGDETTGTRAVEELSAAKSAWATAQHSANEARSEVEALDAELAKAKEDFESWKSAAEEIFGTAESSASASTTQVNTLKAAIDGLPNQKDVYINVIPGTYTPALKAIGDAYIPYDNFPALLHRGEKVLTATQARKSESPNIDLGALEDTVAAAIRSGMEGVTVNSYLNGRSVTEEVNRETVRQIKGRRFTK